MNESSFDSNILIDSLNGNSQAKAELFRVTHRWISRLTWIEVMSKVPPEQDRIMEIFFDDFQIDEVTKPIGRKAAELRLHRPKLKLPDAVIFASAQVNGRTLVTRNTKDFPADMPGIHIPYAP